MSSEIPSEIKQVPSETIYPVNIDKRNIHDISPSKINPVIEHASNIEIIDNVHIEQAIDTEGHVQSNEKPIGQKENININQDEEIDQLKLADAIRHLVHIYV